MFLLLPILRRLIFISGCVSLIGATDAFMSCITNSSVHRFGAANQTELIHNKPQTSFMLNLVVLVCYSSCFLCALIMAGVDVMIGVKYNVTAAEMISGLSWEQVALADSQFRYIFWGNLVFAYLQTYKQN